MALKHETEYSATSGDKTLRLDLSRLTGTEIGYAIRDQLSPRSQGRAIVAATSKVGMFGHTFLILYLIRLG